MTVCTMPDGVDGEPAALPVLADRLLVLGEVHARDRVVGHVALHPLQSGSHGREDADRLL